jgi:3-hydroxyisobutyrate dehydrogenase
MCKGLPFGRSFLTDHTEGEYVTKSIGWIGVGLMGEAMAERLLAAGIDVTVWNRTPAKCAALVEKGARLVPRPADAAAETVVFSMVMDDAALKSLWSREGGVLEGSARVWVDCSSVSPEAAAEAADAARERGITMISAPVSGNPSVVRAGNLIFAASGPAAAIEEARPYFAVIGRALHIVGDAQQATVVKLCTNALLGVVMQAVSEVVVLGERSGIARAALMEFINDSAVGSPFTAYKTQSIVNLDFTPTFTAEALRKDLRLALSLADSVEVAMPVVGETEHQLDRVVDTQNGSVLDFASTLLLVAKDARLELRLEETS